MLMKRFRLVLFVIALCATGAGAASPREYRNIFSASYIDYSGIGISKTLENTLVVSWSPRLSTMTRVYHDERSPWNNTIGYGGATYVFSGAGYAEFSCGYGADSGGRDSRHFSLDFTREKTRYLLTGGIRHSRYPGFSVTVLSPAALWTITSRTAVWGKYFASRDSHGIWDHAYWTEVRHTIGKTSLAAGATGGNRLYRPEYESLPGEGGTGRFHSWLARVSYSPSGRTAFRCQYEQLTRDGRDVDHKSSLLIDTRF